MSIHSSSPYPGPRPFQTSERDLFFGRQDEIADVISLITAHRAVLLYSQSGAGKSSLLKAGLIPLMAEKGYQILRIARVGGGIAPELKLEQVDNVFVLAVVSAWTEDSEEWQLSIGEYLKNLERPQTAWKTPVLRVLIFDQFEELFSSHLDRWEDRQRFIEQIAAAMLEDQRLRVVFVMREEYVTRLERYAPLLPDNLRTRFRLERLDKTAGLEAIKGPMEKRGRSFAPGVAEKLANALLLERVQVEERGITRTVERPGEFLEPLQLQIICQELWNLNRKQITFDQLSKIGNVDQVLARFYDGAVRSAAKQGGIEERKLRAWCENALITLIGTRSLVYKDQWKRDSIPDQTIDELERRHFLRRKTRAGAHWYELIHDRFINPIRLSNKAFFIEQSTIRDEATHKAAHVDDVLRTSGLRKRTGQNVKEESETLLRELAQELRKDIPFDLCSVSVLSRDAKEAKVVFLYPREEFLRRQRWYDVPRFLRTTEWSRRVNFIDNLPALRRQFSTPNARREVERLYSSGYISLLRYPVLLGGNVVASMTLLSKTTSYSEKHQKLLARITAIEKCLINVAYSQQTQELQFRFELLKKLFAMKQNKQIAEILCRDLAAHYAWETVAIFAVDKNAKRFLLVGQNCKRKTTHTGTDRDHFCLASGYSQPLDKGILGITYSENRDVKIDDLDVESRYHDVYIKSRDDAKSELSMRIMVDGEIRWLLNIEDSQRNAFSNEEKRTLRELLDRVGTLVERITAANLITATFEATMTAVFVTDSRGLIRVANPSALRMFGTNDRELKGKWVGDYFSDRSTAERLLSERKTPPTEVRMRSSTGKEVDVLVSSSALNEVLSSRVLSIQGMEAQ